MLFMFWAGPAQSQGRIQGTVVDRETREPLFGANVLVRGTLLGTVTDLSGRFDIPHVPQGAVTLEVSLIGYEKRIMPNVRVGENQTASVRVEMDATVLLQETTV
ncbi:MAG TPA: carboxypeptidase-like regulatory domain-containing protein, partial [bacterium]